MRKEPNPAEILAFWRDAGVDTMLEDAPVDRFALAEAMAKVREAARPAQARTAPQRPTPAPRPRETAAVAVPDENAVRAAREAAAKASSLTELRAALDAFDGCNLKRAARSTVFADGNPEAPLMLIGEAPDRDEDEQGQPFVGRSGQLLDRMLGAIGLDRTGVYIANVIPWRPPGNRAPTPLETALCKPFIERHMELAGPEGAGPKVIMLLGGTSAKTMMDTKAGIMSLAGKWTTLSVAGRDVPTLPTLHPAFLLRQPQQKRHIWNDMLAVKARLSA